MDAHRSTAAKVGDSIQWSRLRNSTDSPGLQNTAARPGYNSTQTPTASPARRAHHARRGSA